MKHINKINSWLRTTWLFRVTPYYWGHAIIASLISLVFLLPHTWVFVGSVAYLFRELAQIEEKTDAWKRDGMIESKPKFDWKGFLYPLGISILALIIIITNK